MIQWLHVATVSRATHLGDIMSFQGKVAMITVGNTALFLASDDAWSITRTELVVVGDYITA
jgi:hypothetical protein